MQNSLRARLAFTAALVVFGGVIFTSTRRGQPDWNKIAFIVTSFSQIMDFLVIPFFLLGATLIAWKRTTQLALVVAIGGFIFGVCAATVPLLQETMYISRAPMLLRVAASPSLALGGISLVLLWVQKFRQDFAHVRAAALLVMAILLAVHIAALLGFLPLGSLWVEAPRAIFSALAFGFFCFTSWCMAFCQQSSPEMAASAD